MTHQPSLFDPPPVGISNSDQQLYPAIDPRLEETWKKALAGEFREPYFVEIKKALHDEKQRGYAIYPPGRYIFNAYDNTPFDKVRVVILGQDPYPGKGQAHGLCFSVPDGVPPPPSLMNIFQELQSDLGIPLPRTGNLEKWAQQGVFLLNTILTVRAGEPASHRHFGWEQFTDATIQKLSEQRQGIIFLLWGKFARDKAMLIDGRKHHFLTAVHPSPLSAHSGFFGCRHFSKTNELLKQQGKEPIDWSL